MSIINCKELVSARKIRLAADVQSSGFTANTLAVIQVGDNQASNSYIKGKEKDRQEIGIAFQHIKLPVEIDTDSVISVINTLNITKQVAGIIVQLPLPPHLDTEKIINSVADEKDVDGFKPASQFTPCTPLGIMSILDDISYSVLGKTVCVIGQGKTVGKPLFELLTKAGATVISCNSKTPHDKLLKFIKECDVLVTAAGKAGMISKANFWHQGEKRYIFPDVIIDVGINRDENGKLCGDCAKDLWEENLLITPVPGGVGLYTRISLMENTYLASLAQQSDIDNEQI